MQLNKQHWKLAVFTLTLTLARNEIFTLYYKHQDKIDRSDFIDSINKMFEKPRQSRSPSLRSPKGDVTPKGFRDSFAPPGNPSGTDAPQSRRDGTVTNPWVDPERVKGMDISSYSLELFIQVKFTDDDDVPYVIKLLQKILKEKIDLQELHFNYAPTAEGAKRAKIDFLERINYLG